MSRSNSLYNEPILESMQMMKFSSKTSFSTDLNHTDLTMYDQINPRYTSSSHGRRFSNEDQSLLLVGAGGAGHDTHFSHSYPSTDKHSHFQSSCGESMERTQSNESSASSASSLASSRSKQRLAAQIELAARRLMPKGGSGGHTMSRDNSSESMICIDLKDGSQDKIAISKPCYQRPKHDRVCCKQCDDYPDGFRGEHELRRHQDRQHKKLVKKYVCTTPPAATCETAQPIAKPAVSLSKCKACQHKKQYNAYYNAAAHLRRAHFRPKAKGRSKSSGKLEEAQKRGGKGGGNWPTMEELKPWMVEIEVLVTDSMLTSTQQDDVDASEDEYDEILNEPTSAYTLDSMSSGAFENPYLITDAAFPTYPATNTNDMFSMQSMQNMEQYIDLSSQQTIDSSMSLSPNSFDSFSFSQNDQMAFEHSSIPIPQAFDDQFVGIEPVYSYQ